MEPLVATGGNRWQITQPRKRRNQAKTVAVGCNPLPPRRHGKGRVYATSLLLERASPSWLRSEKSSPANPKAGGTRGDANTSAALTARRRKRLRRVRDLG